MKACCLISASTGLSAYAAAWVKALDCEVLTYDAYILASQKKSPYALVLIEIGAANFQEGRMIAGILRKQQHVITIIMVPELLPCNTSERNTWKQLLSQAHLLFTHDSRIVSDIKEVTGLNARLLYPPYDTEAMKASFAKNPKNTFTVVTDGAYTIPQFIREIGWPLFIYTFLRYAIRIVSAKDRKQVKEALSRSALVYVPGPLQDGGYVAVCCALAGSVLIANREYSPGKVVYPYTMFDVRHKRRALILLWIYSSRSFRRFFIDNAAHNRIHFNPANRKAHLLNLLRYKFPEFSFAGLRKATSGLKDQIHYYSGLRHVRYSENECALVCLLRNGEEYISSFLTHYRALGVKHFFFLDNGSDDRTLELLKDNADVTIYQTSLPHKYYENDMRRIVIEMHCRNRWCLNVDIDELFDYPFSDRLPLNALLEYMKENKYTALAGYMLDMFARENAFSSAGSLDLKKAYPCYDVSNIEKKEYHAPDVVAYCDKNELSSAEIKCYFGGIRKTIFASKTAGHYLLTKHPLIFLDGMLEPVTNPHYSNNARIADLSCVLYHYKFTPSFRHRVLESRRSGRYIKFAQNQYDQYYKKVLQKASILIDTPGTRRLAHVNDLIADGFLTVSPAYMEYAKAYNSLAQPAYM